MEATGTKLGLVSGHHFLHVTYMHIILQPVPPSPQMVRAISCPDTYQTALSQIQRTPRVLIG